MTKHAWREHINKTRMENPNINNFGDIIKLAKKTYKKQENNSNKKTAKNLQLGGKKIMTTKRDKDGNIDNNKKVVEGECDFPFKHYGKDKYECVDSKKGKWCAVTKDKDGKKDTWGYCILDDEEEVVVEQKDKLSSKQQEEVIEKKDKSSSKQQEEQEEVVEQEEEKKDKSSSKQEEVVEQEEEQKDKSSSKQEEVELEEDEIITYPIEYDGKNYLLHKETRNIYSYPNEEGEFEYVGRVMPNGNIDFDAEEYKPEMTDLEEED